MKQKLVKKSLFMAIFGLFWWGISPASTQAMVATQAVGSYSGANCTLDTTNADAIIARTNVERERAGLSPLSYNRMLSEAAELKAQDMITAHYWGHVSPTGVTPWDWLQRVGYDFLYAAENLAEGGNGTDNVVESWLDSPEHKANLLNPLYTETGVAVECGVTDRETTLVVAEYDSPR